MQRIEGPPFGSFSLSAEQARVLRGSDEAAKQGVADALYVLLHE